MENKYNQESLLFETFIDQLPYWYLNNEMPESCSLKIQEELRIQKEKMNTQRVFVSVYLEPLSDVQLYTEKEISNSRQESIYYQKFFRKRIYYKNGHKIYVKRDYVYGVMSFFNHTMTHFDWVKDMEYFQHRTLHVYSRNTLILCLSVATVFSLLVCFAHGFEFYTIVFVFLFIFMFYLYFILLYFLASLVILIIKGVYVGVRTLHFGGTRNHRMLSFYSYNPEFASYDLERYLVTLAQSEMLQENDLILDSQYAMEYQILSIDRKEEAVDIQADVYFKNTYIQNLFMYTKKQKFPISFSLPIDAIQNRILFDEALQK